MTLSAYRKEIRMRFAGEGAVVITLPKPIVERAARSRGLTIGEFIKKYRAVCLYNNFTQFDTAFRFEPIKDEEILKISEEELGELAPQPQEEEPEVGFKELRRRLKGGK